MRALRLALGRLPLLRSGAETAAAKPGRVTAKLRVEKRRSGKVVTVVEGLPGGAADLESLLREWKRTCGTGGTLQHEGTIELQGDQRERLRPSCRRTDGR